MHKTAYLSGAELKEYMEFVKVSNPAIYIASNLIVHGGFMISEIERIPVSAFKEPYILNERLLRVMAFSDDFRAYLESYISDIPSDYMFYAHSRNGLVKLDQKKIALHIRRAFSHLHIDATASNLLSTFYLRYLANCGTLAHLPHNLYQRSSWVEAHVGIDLDTYKEYKDTYNGTELPSDFLYLASAMFKYALKEPILNDKIHRIYSLMADCVTIMSDSLPM